MFVVVPTTECWALPNTCTVLFPGLGLIGYVTIDMSEYKELKTEDGLAAVALSDDTLLWMTATGNDSCVDLASNETT